MLLARNTKVSYSEGECAIGAQHEHKAMGSVPSQSCA